MITAFLRPAAALGLGLILSFGTLGATAAPARAEAQVSGQEVAQFLGGLIALYAIGRVISDAQDRQPAVTQAPRPHHRPGFAPQPHRPPVVAPQPHRPRAQVPHRPFPQGQWQGRGGHRGQALVAPARCFTEGRDRNGVYRGYVLSCMQNNVRNTQALPSGCLTRVETPRGARMIYGGRCLAQNGWVRG